MMKIFHSYFCFFIFIAFVNSSFLKADFLIDDFDLDDVLKSGRNLMKLDYGLHYLEIEQNSQNTLFVAVHGGDSEGYEWIYPLITIDSSNILSSYYRYNDDFCPNRVYLKLASEISNILDSKKNITNVILMGHSYGGMIVAMFSDRWVNEVPLIIHTVAGPLSGPISTSFKSTLFKSICEYSPPKLMRDNVSFFQWRTIKELDGAFKSLDYDPQIIDLKGSTIIRLPETYNGRRLGHNWSLSWVAEEITN